MANSTVGTIIGYGLQEGKIDTDTNIAGLDVTTALVRIVDRENRNFIEAPNEANQPGWDYMISEVGFTIQSATTITGDLTPSSVTIPVADATIFSTEAARTSTTGGAFVIFTNNVPDVGLYGAISSLNLTGCTQIGFNHTANNSIYTLYKLPTDFSRPRGERYRSDGLTIDTNPYFYGGTGVPNGRNFSIFLDASTNTSYVWVPRDMTGLALMRYDKAATLLTLQTQLIDVPVAYEEYIIQKVAAHAMRVLSKDPQKIADAESIANGVLRSAFDKRSISKRIALTRGPIRSPSFFSSGHYMSASGDIY